MGGVLSLGPATPSQRIRLAARSSAQDGARSWTGFCYGVVRELVLTVQKAAQRAEASIPKLSSKCVRVGKGATFENDNTQY